MKKLIKKFANLFGYEVISKKSLDIATHLEGQASFSQDRYLWLYDKKFNGLYEKAIQKTKDSEAFHHKVRSYTLLQLLQLVIKKFENNTVQNFAECGVLKGMTVYEMCSILKEHKNRNKKITFHAFDSFEGISPRQKEDTVNELVPEKSLSKNLVGTGKGSLSCSLEEVKKNLEEFDFIKYHKGWIPDSFKNFPDREYMFVHIDLDVYQPTLAAFEYFYPRMANGGIIVCDDYGSLYWPGAYKAVEEFSKKYNEPILRLTTSQAIVIKNAFQPITK